MSPARLVSSGKVVVVLGAGVGWGGVSLCIFCCPNYLQTPSGWSGLSSLCARSWRNLRTSGAVLHFSIESGTRLAQGPVIEASLEGRYPDDCLLKLQGLVSLLPLCFVDRQFRLVMRKKG